jgi:hypothetical protein
MAWPRVLVADPHGLSPVGWVLVPGPDGFHLSCRCPSRFLRRGPFLVAATADFASPAREQFPPADASFPKPADGLPGASHEVWFPSAFVGHAALNESGEGSFGPASALALALVWPRRRLAT